MCALPNSVDPAAPAGSDALSGGDDQIRALKQFLVDVFGLVSSPTQITAAPTSISAAGVLAHLVSPLNLTAGSDFVVGTTDNFALIFKTNGTNRWTISSTGYLTGSLAILNDLAGDPTTAGQVARNATLIKFYDGTAARTLLTARDRLQAVRTTDQVISATTTLANDDTLFVSVEANSKYLVRLILFYNADSGGGVKIGWSGPASAGFTWNGLRSHGTVIYPPTGLTISDTLSAGDQGASVTTVMWVNGVVTTGGTAGTFRLRVAQDSAAGVTNILQTSWLQLDRYQQ